MKTEEKKPNNPSAYLFQQIEYNEISGNSEKNKEKGMTLRDYFANSAMKGLLACNAKYGGVTNNREALSRDAYLTADAMLKQREL